MRRIVTVNNVNPNVSAANDQSADEETSGTFDLGSFTDPGQDGDWSVTVDWGDSSTDTTFPANQPGSLGQKSHTYAVFAPTSQISVTSNGAASTSTARGRPPSTSAPAPSTTSPSPAPGRAA